MYFPDPLCIGAACLATDASRRFSQYLRRRTSAMTHNGDRHGKRRYGGRRAVARTSS
ncbi:protein of unknown function (plasmid) [Caballeronia sp. S22]